MCLMKIKSKLLYAYLPVVIAVWFLPTMVKGSDIWTIISVGICFFYTVVAIFPELRILTMEKEKCTVRWLFWKKTYKWEDMAIICHDIIMLPRMSLEGIYFSSKPLVGKKERDFSKKIKYSFDFLNCFYIIFNNEKEKQRILQQLEEWNVTVKKGKVLEERECYDNMLAMRKRVREGRKQYAERYKRNKSE